MYKLSFLISGFSYFIFFLGLAGLLSSVVISALLTIFLGAFFIFFRKDLDIDLFIRSINSLKSLSRLYIFITFLLFVQIVINFVGSLAPEIAFDALWYHLTIPKIFLEEGRIFFISGGLLYYSVMPKLIDLLYIPALFMGGATAAKLVHFGFGVLSLFVTYKLSRKLLPKELSILAVFILSSNLVFAWQSTTAYIDLGRTFFELMAVFSFFEWFEKRKNKYIFLSGLLLGFAIATKWLAAGSLLIYLFLFVILFLSKKISFKKMLKVGSLWIGGVMIPIIPWILFSFGNTGNLFYPFFTSIYPTSFSIALISPLSFLGDASAIFTRADDPVLPIYLITLPLLILAVRKMPTSVKLLFYFSIISFFVWYIEPRTGGGRFLLPYLPMYSILIAYIVFIYKAKGKIYQLLLAVLVVLGITTALYRIGASYSYIPLLFSEQKRVEYLINNLNYNFGDFYDVDRFFERTIGPGDKVLIYGIHNLYYVEFPFIHESWIEKGDRFNYVLVQGGEVPFEFSDSRLIYENNQTRVKLYKKVEGVWEY